MSIKQTERGGAGSDLRSPDAKGNLGTAYFTSVSVENVLCFGPRQTLSLARDDGTPARWTVILGDNGVGKTTILRAIASITPVQCEISGRNEIVARCFRDTRAPWWLRVREEFSTPLIRATFSRGTGLEDQGTIGDLDHISEVSFLWKRESDIPSEMVSSPGDLSEEIPVFAYGAARRVGGGPISGGKEESEVTSLFSDDVSLCNAEEWLLQADYAAVKSKDKNLAARRDTVRDLLIDLLPDVTEIRIETSKQNGGRTWVEFKTPYGWSTLQHLGLGYRTLMAWMVDLASRMFERYPDSKAPLAERAVVLVDEIDLHLHPKWQRSLQSYLTQRFPNTQFICTAHSPLVVQAVEDANIVLLRREGDHVVIDNNPVNVDGWRVDQILTSELFGLPSARPPKYEALQEKRTKLLSKARLTTKDKKKLAAIDSEISALPTAETPEDIEAMEIIRKAADKLKNGGKRRGGSH